MNRNALLLLVKRFLATGVTEKARLRVDCSYKDQYKRLTDYFNSPKVLSATRAMLCRICFLSSSIHNACVVNHGDFKYTQAFLMAYSIDNHLQRVGMLCNPIGIELIKTARVLSSVFDQIVNIIQESKSFGKIPSDLSLKFNSGLIGFFRTYKEWEKSDNVCSSSRIRFALVSLYCSYFVMSKDSATRSVIEEQINFRRDTMLQCFGSEALEKFDADLGSGKFGLPPIPDVKAIESLLSDPKFFVTRQLNRVLLIRDLIADINFRVSINTMKEVPIHVYSTFSRDNGFYWSTVFQELTLSPRPSFRIVWECLIGFKQQLVTMVDKERVAWVQASINIQGDGRSVEWIECVSVLRQIVSVLQKVQMPARDKETADGWMAFDTIDDPEVMIGALQFVNTRIKIAELDFHNLGVLMISHGFRQNCVSSVTDKFKEMLKSGSITMERTKVRMLFDIVFFFVLYSKCFSYLFSCCITAVDC